MEGGAGEDPGAPESWEAADVEESMQRLILSNSSSNSSSSLKAGKDYAASNLDLDSSGLGGGSGVGLGKSVATVGTGGGGVKSGYGGGGGLSDAAISQVDQFLREALQNPRERLSILRMEQDVEKFIRDPNQLQLEFQQLPTSYLRLAAHRVAQHYFLQSTVLLDDNLPDGSGSRIIIRKTSRDCQIPRIRLADIPVDLPQEGNGVVKVAIKQRPQKWSPNISSSNPNSSKTNQPKSVEERKEEYNRARARIFNASNNSGSSIGQVENESRIDNYQHSFVGSSRLEGKNSPTRRVVVDSLAGSSSSGRSRTEKEPVARYKPNNRVAIFRDREVERKDPDYDRSYDRYMQRFDPGFGFNSGPYTIQPMYTPALNYNTEFPQLGAVHRPRISAEHQPRPPPHMPSPWTSSSNPNVIGYGHPETLLTAYDPTHVSARTLSTVYLHSSQYPAQRVHQTFIHPQEHLHQPFSMSHQQQHDATLGLARPR